MSTVISASSVVGARSRTGLARGIFRWTHLVVGLSLGLILAVQGLSGSVLVWRPELDRVMAPALTHAESSERTASLDQEQAQVSAVAQGGKVRMVRLAVAPGGTDEWMVTLPGGAGQSGGSGRWTVYASPATGRVLGVRGAKRDALQFLIELHHSLLMGEFGRGVLGWVAVGTVVLALSGLWMWWPARWTSSRFRPRAAAKPLHYAVGFWVMWPLLAIAVSAMYFVWRQPVQRMFGVAGPQMAQHRDGGAQGGRSRHGDGGRAGDDAMSGERHHDAALSASVDANEKHHGADPAADTRAESRHEATGSGTNVDAGERHHGADSGGHADAHAKVSLDAVLAAARVAEPAARMTMIRFPEDGGDYTVMFERWRHYRAAPDSMTVATLPDGSVKVGRVILWEQLPVKKRMLEWLPRVHQAEFGGVVVRLLWTVTGWMPAVLYVSGFLMWRRRVAASQVL